MHDRMGIMLFLILLTYLIKSDDRVHDILIGAIHRILMSLNVQSVQSLMLAEPSKNREAADLVRMCFKNDGSMRE